MGRLLLHVIKSGDIGETFDFRAGGAEGIRTPDFPLSVDQGLNRPYSRVLNEKRSQPERPRKEHTAYPISP